MKCAYCGKDAHPTKEHIISSGVLDLFPECFMTMDSKRGKSYPADPVISDVCADCNNHKISYIDSYAKDFISRYFVKKYDPDTKLEVEYDYVMVTKMLLKYAFNDLRAQHGDTSFFTSEIREYLMFQTNNQPLKNVTIMAGLSINTSPAPDFMFGNLKLQWSNTPVFFANSIIENINYETGQIKLRDPFEIEEMPGLLLSYVFRFSSGQFLLLCWDEENPKSQDGKVIVKFQYPYTVLTPEKNTVELTRCTSETTYHHFQLIDVTWGQGISDEISLMRKVANPNQEKYFREMTEAWEQEEIELANKHKRL